MLSVVGVQSDPALFDIEQLLSSWFPQLEAGRVAKANHMLRLQHHDVVAASPPQFFAAIFLN